MPSQPLTSRGTGPALPCNGLLCRRHRGHQVAPSSSQHWTGTRLGSGTDPPWPFAPCRLCPQCGHQGNHQQGRRAWGLRLGPQGVRAAAQHSPAQRSSGSTDRRATRPPAQPGRQRRLCTGWSSRTWPAAERYLPALSQHQQLSSSAPPPPTSTTLPASSSPQPKPRAPRQPSPCAMCVLWAASGTVGGARTEARTHSLHWARPCHSWSWALLHLGNDHHSLTHTQCHARQTDQAQLACRAHALTALGTNRSSTANAKSALLNANKYKPRAGLGPAAPRLNTPASTLLLPRTDHSTKGRITRSSMATHTNRQYHRHPRTHCHGNAGNQQHVLDNGNRPTAALPVPAGRTCVWALTALGRQRAGTRSSVSAQTRHAARCLPPRGKHQRTKPSWHRSPTSPAPALTPPADFHLTGASSRVTLTTKTGQALASTPEHPRGLCKAQGDWNSKTALGLALWAGLAKPAPQGAACSHCCPTPHSPSC